MFLSLKNAMFLALIFTTVAPMFTVATDLVPAELNPAAAMIANCPEGEKRHSYFWSIHASPSGADFDITSNDTNTEPIAYLFGILHVSASLMRDFIPAEIRAKLEESDFLLQQMDYGNPTAFRDCFARLLAQNQTINGALKERLSAVLSPRDLKAAKHWGLFHVANWDALPPQWMLLNLMSVKALLEQKQLTAGEDKQFVQQLQQWAVNANGTIKYMERLEERCEYMPSLAADPELMEFAFNFLLSELDAMGWDNATRPLPRPGPIERSICRYLRGNFELEDDFLGNGENLYGKPLDAVEQTELRKVNRLIRQDMVVETAHRLIDQIDKELSKAVLVGMRPFIVVDVGLLMGYGSLLDLLEARGYTLREEFIPPMYKLPNNVDMNELEEEVVTVPAEQPKWKKWIAPIVQASIPVLGTIGIVLLVCCTLCCFCCYQLCRKLAKCCCRRNDLEQSGITHESYVHKGSDQNLITTAPQQKHGSKAAGQQDGMVSVITKPMPPPFQMTMQPDQNPSRPRYNVPKTTSFKPTSESAPLGKDNLGLSPVKEEPSHIQHIDDTTNTNSSRVTSYSSIEQHRISIEVNGQEDTSTVSSPIMQSTPYQRPAMPEIVPKQNVAPVELRADSLVTDTKAPNVLPPPQYQPTSGYYNPYQAAAPQQMHLVQEQTETVSVKTAQQAPLATGDENSSVDGTQQITAQQNHEDTTLMAPPQCQQADQQDVHVQATDAKDTNGSIVEAKDENQKDDQSKLSKEQPEPAQTAGGKQFSEQQVAINMGEEKEAAHQNGVGVDDNNEGWI